MKTNFKKLICSAITLFAMLTIRHEISRQQTLNIIDENIYSGDLWMAWPNSNNIPSSLWEARATPDKLYYNKKSTKITSNYL